MWNTPQIKGEAFEYLTGFAAKAPEMAVRIAGVQTLYADEHATEITEEMMSNGIALMDCRSRSQGFGEVRRGEVEGGQSVMG